MCRHFRAGLWIDNRTNDSISCTYFTIIECSVWLTNNTTCSSILFDKNWYFIFRNCQITSSLCIVIRALNMLVLFAPMNGFIDFVRAQTLPRAFISEVLPNIRLFTAFILLCVCRFFNPFNQSSCSLCRRLIKRFSASHGLFCVYPVLFLPESISCRASAAASSADFIAWA